jgi:TatD DNase family protein
MLIDSHAHLSKKDYKDLEGVLERAFQSNLSHIINICTDEASLEESLELEKKYRNLHSAASTTPHDVKEEDLFFPKIAKYASQKKLIAIGETGLDYHYGYMNKDSQKKTFIAYVELAKKYDLPLIIHCRDAFFDLFEITKKYLPLKAVLHCFTGNLEEALKVLENNWLISFSGIVTFKNSQSLREVVKSVPLEKMLIETDSPFLAPQKMRGKINEPSFLKEIAQTIAEVKNTSFDLVAERTTQNATNFFQIKKD